MPSSTSPRFGQVWKYETVEYMLVAPDATRAFASAWWVLTVKAADVPSWNFLVNRMHGGRDVLDSMGGLPGEIDYLDPAWEMVEDWPR